MRYFVVRHADKHFGGHFNPILRHQDEPISQQGRSDSQKLASYFLDKKIAAIYVSEYQRTWQTAEPLAGQFNLVPAVDQRLNELDSGVTEGLSEQELQGRYPEVWKAFVERTADFRFPEGETGEEARQRIVAFLDEKRALHGDENIVAVCHDGLIRVLVCHVMGAPVYHRWNLRVDFCGITEIAFDPSANRWKLIRFNQSA